jgi:hypothetical protein
MRIVTIIFGLALASESARAQLTLLHEIRVPTSEGVNVGHNTLYGASIVQSRLIATSMYPDDDRDLLESNSSGSLFSMALNGSDYRVLSDVRPTTSLTFANNKMYGAASSFNGFTNTATIFSMNPDGTDYDILHSFPPTRFSANTTWGVSTPLLAVDSKLYGVTRRWKGGGGVFFSLNFDGTEFQELNRIPDEFNFAGTNLVTDGSKLYGTASADRPGHGRGVLYAMNLDGSGFSQFHEFDQDPKYAHWQNLLIVGTKLFGTTTSGHSDPSNIGYLYSINLDGSAFQVLHTFNNSIGSGDSPLMVSGSRLIGTTTRYVPNIQLDPAAGGIYAINMDGSGFTFLKKFSWNDEYVMQLVNADHLPHRVLDISGNTVYLSLFSSGIFSYTLVPEPSSIVLTVLGLLGTWHPFARSRSFPG